MRFYALGVNTLGHLVEVCNQRHHPDIHTISISTLTVNFSEYMKIVKRHTSILYKTLVKVVLHTGEFLRQGFLFLGRSPWRRGPSPPPLDILSLDTVPHRDAPFCSQS